MRNAMTGYEAYKEYLALKNHFTLDNYDYIKYNGRVSASESSFLKRKDKFFFTKLGKKFDGEELKYFLVSNQFHSHKNFEIVLQAFSKLPKINKLKLKL